MTEKGIGIAKERDGTDDLIAMGERNKLMG